MIGRFRFATLSIATMTLVSSSVLCNAAADDAAGLPAKIEFNRDVRPILSNTCFKCHGFDPGARKADLRLDVPESAYARRDDDTTPIVPGKPEQSSIYQRMVSTDRTELMPPPKAKIPLTPRQIAMIRKWIEQGAVYEPHWAYLPVKRPPLPKVKDEKLARNAIDHFILARIEREGIAPSPQATNETLIRRVTLDLTGLPPTPEEVAAFLKECEAEKKSSEFRVPGSELKSKETAPSSSPTRNS